MTADPRGPVYVRYITRIVYCLIFLFGVSGNGIVSYSILMRRSRQPIHKFTLNLALSDLILLLVYLPTQFTLYEAKERWILGEFTCRLTYSLVPLTLTSSIGFLVIITIDRFRAVCFPLSSKITTFQIRLIIAAVWLLAIIVSVPMLTVSGTDEQPKGSGDYYCYETRWPNKTVEHAYWIFLFVVQYALPLVVLITLYPIIIYHLRTGRTISEGTSVRKTSIDRYRRQQAKLIRVVIVLIILYAICMLPQHLVFFWMTYGDFSIFGSYVGYIYQMANALVLLNSALNPLCYGALGKKYNQSIWVCLATLCCKVLCRNKSPVMNALSNDGMHCSIKKNCSCVCPRKSKSNQESKKRKSYSEYSHEKCYLRTRATVSRDVNDLREDSKMLDRHKRHCRRPERDDRKRVQFQRLSARTEITDCQFSSFRRSISYRSNSQRDCSTNSMPSTQSSNFLTVEQATRAERKVTYDSNRSFRSNAGSFERRHEDSNGDTEYKKSTSELLDVNYSIRRDEIQICILTDVLSEENQHADNCNRETDI